MGWRFRKTKRIGPFRLTASKSGLGMSVGTREARIGIGGDGRERETFTVPGTGISYQHEGRGRRRGRSSFGVLHFAVALVVIWLALRGCVALLH